MAEDYRIYKNSLFVAEKYKISNTKVLKWYNSDNLDNRSSAPNTPTIKYWFSLWFFMIFIYHE